MRVRALIRPLWGINVALAALVISAAAAAGLFVGSNILLPGHKYLIATWAWPVVDGAAVPRGRALTGKGGLLAGQTNLDGTACFWLGDAETREALMWPPGSVARSEPLRVIDESGHVAATVGEYVSLDGATAAPEAILGKGILGCPASWPVVIVAP